MQIKLSQPYNFIVNPAKNESTKKYACLMNTYFYLLTKKNITFVPRLQILFPKEVKKKKTKKREGNHFQK